MIQDIKCIKCNREFIRSINGSINIPAEYIVCDECLRELTITFKSTYIETYISRCKEILPKTIKKVTFYKAGFQKFLAKDISVPDHIIQHLYPELFFDINTEEIQTYIINK